MDSLALCRFRDEEAPRPLLPPPPSSPPPPPPPPTPCLRVPKEPVILAESGSGVFRTSASKTYVEVCIERPVR